jgi:hypothetical protein
MNWRRALQSVGALIAVVCAGAAAFVPAREANASVSIAVSWEGLLAASSAAAVVSPTEAYAVWEGGRILTYTRVHVDRPIAGDLSSNDVVWIRTRGGIVGHIGQQVEGEALLASGPSLVFLFRGATSTSSTYEVTARAQGQFPVTADGTATPPRVSPNRACGMLVPRALPTPALPPRLASEVLSDRTVDDAAREIAAAWSAAHAH